MYTIAIVGAGQLGSRHLQAIARIDEDAEVHVVEPSAAAREVARQRYGQMPPNPRVRLAGLYGELAALPQRIDYAIVATSADVRLAVLEGLLAHSQVRYLLLEKVLFQRASDYAKAAELVAAAGARAWVNTLRREFGFYERLREFFAGEPLVYFQVRGGDWGLACNSIHFLDLFAMLADDDELSIDASGLDDGVVESKRRGFIELTGALRARGARGARIELAAQPGPMRLLIQVRSAERVCLVDEARGTALFESGAGWRSETFCLPLLSEAGAALAESLLRYGNCRLPTLQQSTRLHLALLDAISPFLQARGRLGAAGACPIT